MRNRLPLLISALLVIGCGGQEHPDHAEDDELAALRAAAADEAEEAPSRGKEWSQADEDGHDHAEHDHSGHGHDGHDDHDDHDDHADHDDHNDHDDHDGQEHSDANQNDDDVWLPQVARKALLEREPADLWSGRYADAVELTVERAFELESWSIESLVHGEPRLTRAEPILVQPGDRLRVAGVVGGYTGHGEHVHTLGELQVYLLRSGDAVTRVLSRDLLQLHDLQPGSASSFIAKQPVTFYAYHPGNKEAKTLMQFVRVRRVTAAKARQWARFLGSLPTASGLESLRESDPSAATAAEAKLRKLFKTFAKNDEPLVFQFRCPTGAVGLVQWRFKRTLSLPSSQ